MNRISQGPYVPSLHVLMRFGRMDYFTSIRWESGQLITYLFFYILAFLSSKILNILQKKISCFGIKSIPRIQHLKLFL